MFTFDCALLEDGGGAFFYLVINKFPGYYVVLAAFVAALALLVYTYRFTRVIALCLQGVSPFDEARYAAIDEYAHRMYRPDYSHVSCVVRDDVAAFPPLHGASAPAMSSSEACSSPRQLEGASEVATSPFSSPSVNGPGPLDRADPSYRPIVVGSVLVTNPNIILVDSDAVLADLSFDELCQLEAAEKVYVSRNMEIASDCDSPSNVAALSGAPVDGGVAFGSAIVNDSCADVSSGALSGGVAAAIAGAGKCFSSSVVASADLVSVDAGDSVVGIKRFREDIGDGLGVEETSRKRSKVRFTTAVCGFCCASVLRTVARADALCFGSCAVFAGAKRPRADDIACQEGKRFKAAFADDCLLVSGLSGVSSVVDDRRPISYTSSAAIAMTTAVIATTTAGQSAAPIDAATATTTIATSTAINNPTAVSTTMAASAPMTTAATARLIAVPRASSRRPMVPSSIAIRTSTAMIATPTMATTTSPALASSTNITSKKKWENNKGDHEESDGFDLSAEELDRLLDEIDQELE